MHVREDRMFEILQTLRNGEGAGGRDPDGMYRQFASFRASFAWRGDGGMCLRARGCQPLLLSSRSPLISSRRPFILFPSLQDFETLNGHIIVTSSFLPSLFPLQRSRGACEVKSR